MKRFRIIAFFIVVSLVTVFLSCKIHKNNINSTMLIPAENPNLVDITFKVIGMDSISINKVQDALSKTEGISRNFACWTDTVVFVEYDVSLITKEKIMSVIKDTGFTPVEKMNQ
ncbi:MAG: hypothetical protein NTW49_05350 [Bacteroidia bacterium]|nr:hypothetical protein [Bacteroidia bacterium]